MASLLEKLIYTLQQNEEHLKQFQHIFMEKKISAKTVLLHEGEISNTIYFIKKGCVREWFNKDGKEITFQFFFEGQPVASIDSFINQAPSLFSIESIEPSIVLSIAKTDFEKLIELHPELREKLSEFIFRRFRNYSQLFLSRIKDKPQERYEDLIKNYPDIIKRVPQHYVASFLGITPISLSRIRNRKTK